MKKMNEIIKATLKANEVIKEIQNDVLSNIEKFESVNLKLHDISYYMYSEMENDFPLCYKEIQENETDYFSWFCEDEYSFFEEWAKENKINLNEIIKHIGRSSSFYLHNNDVISVNGRNNQIDFEYLTQYLIECNSNCSNIDSMIKSDGLLEITENNINEIANDFFDNTMIDEYKSDIIDDILIDLNDLIRFSQKNWELYKEDIYKVADYIIDFKKNQVENFKDFLKNYEDELKSDLEYEEKRENAKKEVLKNIENLINDDNLKFSNFTFKINLI